MRKNRIEELRRANGVTQEGLAEKAGMSPGYLSRIERGERGLSVKRAEAIASALGASTAEVLGLDVPNGGHIDGFSEDVSRYSSVGADPMSKMLGEHEYLWKVESNVLDNIGIDVGSFVIISDSQATRNKLQALQAVLVAFHAHDAPERAIRLLRQFVPPHLLITNCSQGNLPTLDMQEDDAQILGVVVSVHRRLTAS